MNCEIIKQCFSQLRLVDISTIIAGLSAAIAAASAYMSYRLSKGIYDEIKADEKLIIGKLQHPDLKEKEHAQPLLHCSIFNKGKRKAYIDSVKAYDYKGKEIEITWSDSADGLGNILYPTQLIGIENSTSLFIRRDDGEKFNFKTKIIIKHSFESKYIEVFYDPSEDE